MSASESGDVRASFAVHGVEHEMPVHVSEFVPEMIPPLPRKKAGEFPSRRGGRRTDFGGHFRADTFVRGSGAVAPRPTPGYFVMNGQLHVHPKTWEKMLATGKLTVEARSPGPLRFMDGI